MLFCYASVVVFAQVIFLTPDIFVMVSYVEIILLATEFCDSGRFRAYGSGRNICIIYMCVYYLYNTYLLAS